ncbi:hypothetical protein CCAND93_1140002 [Capnocytophaga canis]|uniref:Uncharacterized protein n=1 Tax=Capnocytophaga canis TaxID=1848903 RepID=A0A0B7IIJ4_9FLAO|nr:hypothetical protein CCAND93_1140002 [Capnocytophaga canis]
MIKKIPFPVKVISLSKNLLGSFILKLENIKKHFPYLCKAFTPLKSKKVSLWRYFTPVKSLTEKPNTFSLQ